MKKSAAATLLLCASVVGLHVTQVGAGAIEESELRKVEESSALAAARDLPLFNANSEQIQNVFRKLTGCGVDGDLARSFTVRDGNIKQRRC